MRSVATKRGVKFTTVTTTVIRLGRLDAMRAASHPIIPKTDPIAKRISVNGTEKRARNPNWLESGITSAQTEQKMKPTISNSKIAAAIANRMRLALVHLPGE